MDTPLLPTLPIDAPEDGNLVLQIDWSKADELPDRVLSLRRMSYYVAWETEDLRRILPSLTIFTEVPLACTGASCSFAATCPLVQNNTVSRWESGQNCPIEIVEAFRHFYNFINNLGISDDDYTSIQIVNDLVRLLILMRRCDLLMRREDPVEIMVLGVNPRNSQPIESRKVNELLQVQKGLRADINIAYKNLVASKDAKLRERAINKGHQDASSLMADLIAKMREEEEAQNPSAPIDITESLRNSPAPDEYNEYDGPDDCDDNDA